MCLAETILLITHRRLDFELRTTCSYEGPKFSLYMYVVFPSTVPFLRHFIAHSKYLKEVGQSVLSQCTRNDIADFFAIDTCSLIEVRVSSM